MIGRTHRRRAPQGYVALHRDIEELSRLGVGMRSPSRRCNDHRHHRSNGGTPPVTALVGRRNDEAGLSRAEANDEAARRWLVNNMVVGDNEGLEKKPPDRRRLLLNNKLNLQGHRSTRWPQHLDRSPAGRSRARESTRHQQFVRHFKGKAMKIRSRYSPAAAARASMLTSTASSLLAPDPHSHRDAGRGPSGR